MEKRIIEIDGVKVEVDLTTARRIDTFRIGDNVKVYERDTKKIKPGVITSFDNFKDDPSITVAVFTEGSYWDSPKIEFIYFNPSTSDKWDIILASDDEIRVSGDSVVARFEAEIQKKQREADDLKEKLEYFKRFFLHDSMR